MRIPVPKPAEERISQERAFQQQIYRDVILVVADEIWNRKLNEPPDHNHPLLVEK